MKPNIFNSLSFFTGIKKEEPDKNSNKEFEKIREFKMKNLPFQLKSSYKSIIPLKIYTCWHSKELAPLMKKNMDNLKRSNPEFKLYVYDETTCIKFLSKNFNEDVLNAYNTLKPCSYKSDLWRFCNLYIKGGIYIDIKYRCVNNFKLIALTEKEYFVRDRGDYGVYTALIVSMPKNEILWKCIQKIVENVKNNYYGSNALDPTGPGLLGSFFSREEINNMELYFENTDIKNYYNDLYYIMYNDRIILAYYNNYREEQKQYQKLDHYSVLWDKRDIYVK
jgi:mannosyltransferase OCH1-like enzyme